MAEERIEQLLRVERLLSRSFMAYIGALLLNVVFLLFLASPASPRSSLVLLLLLPLQFGVYVWYAISASKAAGALGEAGWKYAVWILVSPFLALVPIPIVSTIIAVSPISIKFLLGGQLQTAIREESTADLHRA